MKTAPLLFPLLFCFGLIVLNFSCKKTDDQIIPDVPDTQESAIKFIAGGYQVHGVQGHWQVDGNNSSTTFNALLEIKFINDSTLGVYNWNLWRVPGNAGNTEVYQFIRAGQDPDHYTHNGVYLTYFAANDSIHYKEESGGLGAGDYKIVDGVRF